MEKKRCYDCGVLEGQYHISGCDWEECPFCNGQLISCGCREEVEEMEQARTVYGNEWEKVLRKKGLIKYGDETRYK